MNELIGKEFRWITKRGLSYSSAVIKKIYIIYAHECSKNWDMTGHRPIFYVVSENDIEYPLDEILLI